jgi:plasmid maintenance system antidote protein VapI
MYIWKKKNLSIRNQKEASERIGVTPQYLSMICGRKVAISKTLAFCIVKFIDSNAEIEDYFVKKGE